MTSKTDETADEGVPIYMTRPEAMKIADLLEANGNEEDGDLAASIRFQAKYSAEVKT